jgi:hypothetical protein
MDTRRFFLDPATQKPSRRVSFANFETLLGRRHRSDCRSKHPRQAQRPDKHDHRDHHN